MASRRSRPAPSPPLHLLSLNDPRPTPAPPSRVCVKLEDHRLCHGLLAELPLTSTDGQKWTLNKKTTRWLIDELETLRMDRGALPPAELFGDTHVLAYAERDLLEAYKQWTHFVTAHAHPSRLVMDEAQWRWAALIESRQWLARAIVLAKHHDGHDYPVRVRPAGVDERAERLRTASVRRGEEAGMVPPPARTLSLEEAERILGV